MSEKKEKKDEELKEPKSEEEASKKAEEKTESKEAGTEKTDDKSKETNEKKPESKKDKKEKTDPKDEKIKSLQDQVLRQMAEFDNFRKRTEKEKASMYSAGAGDVIAKFLPVLDNFERGLADVSDDTDDAFQKGIFAIYKQFKTALDGLGVQEIDALGKTFDPNFHNAVMHAEDEELGENTVSEEFQKGYKYKDAVLRHSMVKVVN